eukprot:PhM_4_TR1256/c2_g1_i2/m.81158
MDGHVLARVAASTPGDWGTRGHCVSCTTGASKSDRRHFGNAQEAEQHGGCRQGRLCRERRVPRLQAGYSGQRPGARKRTAHTHLQRVRRRLPRSVHFTNRQGQGVATACKNGARLEVPRLRKTYAPESQVRTARLQVRWRPGGDSAGESLHGMRHVLPQVACLGTKPQAISLQRLSRDDERQGQGNVVVTIVHAVLTSAQASINSVVITIVIPSAAVGSAVTRTSQGAANSTADESTDQGADEGACKTCIHVSNDVSTSDSSSETTGHDAGKGTIQGPDEGTHEGTRAAPRTCGHEPGIASDAATSKTAVAVSITGATATGFSPEPDKSPSGVGFRGALHRPSLGVSQAHLQGPSAVSDGPVKADTSTAPGVPQGIAGARHGSAPEQVTRVRCDLVPATREGHQGPHVEHCGTEMRERSGGPQAAGSIHESTPTVDVPHAGSGLERRDEAHRAAGESRVTEQRERSHAVGDGADHHPHHAGPQGVFGNPVVVLEQTGGRGSTAHQGCAPQGARAEQRAENSGGALREGKDAVDSAAVHSVYQTAGVVGVAHSEPSGSAAERRDVVRWEQRAGPKPVDHRGEDSDPRGVPVGGSPMRPARQHPQPRANELAPRDGDVVHTAHQQGHVAPLPQRRQGQIKGSRADAPGGLRSLAAKMLKSNRYAQRPKSDTLGIDFGDMPLHVKNVKTISIGAVDSLDVRDENLLSNWYRVRSWILGDHAPLKTKGQAQEARITSSELRSLLDAGQVELTTADDVAGNCHLFPVPEASKNRRRLIKHTKALNDQFGRDTLLSVKLPRTQDLPMTVFAGQHAVTLDFAAWFDQIPLAETERRYHCFPFEGRWYRLTRLPMGQRQAVDVAATITDMLVSFPHDPAVHVTTYIDNIRFIADDPELLIATAANFVMRP